jgi:hypothetical protein
LLIQAAWDWRKKSSFKEERFKAVGDGDGWLSEVQIFLSKVGLRLVSWRLKIARAFVHFQSGTR